ncbi:aldo/keto reductase [Cuniculiplasma sp. SKW4]|uniref:aldo/keto reductase n=1 Tax=Cuniculiplasma sp. SKW4 TaxID=3400171 RepID=UPI003FD6683F
MDRVKFSNYEKLVSPMGVGTYYDPSWIAAARLFKIRRGKEQKVRAIKTALESGINFIDTAEMYQTEPLVRESIQGYDRDTIFIATKVLPTHYTYEKLIKSCNRSLKNLGVKYIDLYQLHMQSSQSKIEEALKAMEFLMDQGKIRQIGISNFDLTHMKMASESLKKYKIASTQMNFNVAHRNIERDILPYCKEEGISILAYFPLSHGKLVNSDEKVKQIMETISKNHGKKTMPQIVLNWFMSKYDFVFPIPRASNPEHVKENAGAMGWKMSEEEIKMLEDAVSGVKATTWFGDHTT